LRSDLLVLVLYVDDLILTGSLEKIIAVCKVVLAEEFDMKDIGKWTHALFLGLEVWQGAGEVFLGQGIYTVEILKRFHMTNCMMPNLKLHVDLDLDLVDPSLYGQLIGSLMYLVNNRPNICVVVNTLSQFMVKPRQIHWIATKHVV
jgi:hypothetical protein